MSKKVIFKKSKKSFGKEIYDVQFQRLTRGEVLSIKNALEGSGTPVSQDVLAYFNNGVADTEEEFLKKILI